jgi:serine protease AprX
LSITHKTFDVDQNPDDIEGAALITIFNTGLSLTELMSRMQITWNSRRSLDETTLFLTKDQYEQLKLKAPYLIAMSVTDMAKIPAYTVEDTGDEPVLIPDPQNEPTIGVIDTLFNEHVYFHTWVTSYTNMVSSDIPVQLIYDPA